MSTPKKPGLLGQTVEQISITNGKLRIVSADNTVRETAVVDA